MSILLTLGSGLFFAVQAAQPTPAVQATLVGSVREEESARALAGVVVSLQELGRSSVTDSAGQYELLHVPAGTHRITLKRMGYAPRIVLALVPRNGVLAIDFSLRRLPVELARVDVRSGARHPRTEAADGAAYPDRSLSSAAIANNPILIQPDVIQSLSGGEVVVRQEAPGGLHIRGGTSDQTAYLLDGIPVFSPYHSAGVFSAWNPDAIASVHLASAVPSSDAPHALSGVVSALSRVPGTRLGTQGALSSTHAAMVFDGPIGKSGAAFLLSVRSGFPGVIAPRGESSYLRGETGDLLVKLELPALGGRLRLIGFDAVNEMAASAAVLSDSGPAPERSGQNAFEWWSRSSGAEWRREIRDATVRVSAWSAAGGANATWNSRLGSQQLTTARGDRGAMVAMQRVAPRTTTLFGARAERTRTSYVVDSDEPGRAFAPSRASSMLVTAFADQVRSLGERTTLTVGASLAAYDAALRVSPHASVKWKAAPKLTVSGSYARTHQYAQSLRDPESIVGTIFPADLFVSAGTAGVPVARSDLGVIAAEYLPSDGVRLGAQVYARDFAGLAMVSPTGGDPFATRSASAGSGVGRGLSVDFVATSARAAVTAAYGLQHVRFRSNGAAYVPEHGARSIVEGGVIVFPRAAWSVRLGGVAAFGRRGTPVSGNLEWEGCNLLDQGCEFAGTPRHSGDSLGVSSLRPYLRLDLGVRRELQLRIGGRSAPVGLFGTITNLLGRRNILAYATDATTGASLPLDMRPLAPLVIGIDWRF